MDKFVFGLVIAWCVFTVFVIVLKLLWGALQLGWFLGKVALAHRARRHRNEVWTLALFDGLWR